MSVIVLKFGGKTIATSEKRLTAAKRVEDCLKKGKKVVVVVSAISDETDKLIELAAEIDGCGHKRELDHLLFTGEVKAAALFSMILLNMGIKARSLNFTNLGIKTDDFHANAKVKSVDPKNIILMLEEGVIPVVPGYQGITETGDVTTLGRGGSDITAVAIAAALKAEACVLFKDVGAIYEDDPKVNVNVHKYDKISYDDLYDIANKGCKVVCRDSIEIARDNDVVISIANPDNFDIGTVIYKN
jgi:aspartate kinase